MIDKERIILLAEEKLYSLLDKEYTDWDEGDRLDARSKFDSMFSYLSESEN